MASTKKQQTKKVKPSKHISSEQHSARGRGQRRAYEVLKERIILQDLPAGEMVSEILLSREMSIGRTPIRWALQRLSLEGLVEVIPQRGVMVTDIDATIQLKLLEVRGQLERLMVTGAAKRSTLAQRQRMRELAAEMRITAANGDGRKFMDVLKTIHDLTALAADNEILDHVIGQVQGLSRRFWFAHYERHGNLLDAGELHALRLEAIAEGNIHAAADASDELVKYLEKFTHSTLSYGFMTPA